MGTSSSRKGCLALMLMIARQMPFALAASLVSLVTIVLFVTAQNVEDPAAKLRGYIASCLLPLGLLCFLFSFVGPFGGQLPAMFAQLSRLPQFSPLQRAILRWFGPISLVLGWVTLPLILVALALFTLVRTEDAARTATSLLLIVSLLQVVAIAFAGVIAAGTAKSPTRRRVE